MRRMLARSVGLALSVGAATASAQEPQWRAVSLGAPVGASEVRAVAYSAPAASLGAPIGATPRLIARGQADDQRTPMPMGTPTPAGTQPLPAPTPVAPGTVSPPVPTGPMTIVPGDGLPYVMGGPIASGQIVHDPNAPGGVAAVDPGFDPAFEQGFAPLPGGVFSPLAAGGACGPLLYFNAEYLLWWIRDSQTPPLLITGTGLNANAPFLVNGAQTIYGNSSVNDQARSGARFTVGGWFSRCNNWGWDASYFFLGEQSQTTTFASNAAGSPILARPFFLPGVNGGPNVPVSEIISAPGVATGSFAATTTSNLWGADVNLKKNLWVGCRSRLDAIAGFRYLRFEETLRIDEMSNGIGQNAGARGFLSDQFDVTNEFYGGQLGLAGEIRRGRWSLNMLTKVGLGNTRQTVNVAGSQTFTNAAGATVTAPGLLALPSNSGTFTRDQFSVVPEVGLTLGWQATHHLKLFVGYNFLYWSNVLRAGDQVDTVLNVTDPRTLTAPPIRQLGTPPTRPVVPFRDSDFWAQGVNFGLQLTW